MSILGSMFTKRLVPAVFRDFRGGRVTALASHEVGPSQSPDMANVLIDEVPHALVSRRGVTKLGAAPSGNALRGMWLFKTPAGTEKVVVTDGATVWSTTDFVTFTSLITGLNNAYDLDAVMVRDKLWLTNGNDSVRTYDGTSIVVLDGTGGTPNVPKGRYILYALNRVWVLNVTGTESDASFCALFDTSGVAIAPDNASAWPSGNALSIAKNDGDQLFGAVESHGTVYFFKGTSIHRLVGVDELSFATVLHVQNIGTRFRRTLVPVDGVPHFLGPNGIYEMQGGVPRLLSRLIQADFDDLAQPDIRFLFKLWNVKADFDAGTLTNVNSGQKSGSIMLSPDMTAGALADDFNASFAAIWTVPAGWTRGSPNAGGTAAVRNVADSSTFDESLSLKAASTRAYGVWSFKMTMNWVGPAPNMWDLAGYKFVHQESDGSGYWLQVRQSATNNIRYVALYKRSGGADTIIGSQYTWSAAPNTYDTLQIERTAAGAFTVKLNGSSIITGTDTTITDCTHVLVWGICTAGGATNLSVWIDDVYWAKFLTSGNWVSEAIDTETPTAKTIWGQIEATSVLNGQTAAYSLRAEAASPPVGAYTTVTPATLIPFAIGAGTRYIQMKIALSTTDALVSPEVQNAKLNWVAGGKAAQAPAAIAFKRRYWLTVTRKSTGATANDLILVRSRREFTPQDQEAAWTYFTGMNISQFMEWQGSLYGADSRSGSYCLQLDTGYRDMNSSGAVAAIDSYWQTRDETFGALPNFKQLLGIELDFKQKGNWSLSMGYSRDGGSTFTEVTVNLSGSARADKTLNINGGQARQFRLRFRINAQDSPFEIYGAVAKALVSRVGEAIG